MKNETKRVRERKDEDSVKRVEREATIVFERDGLRIGVRDNGGEGGKRRVEQ